MASNQSDLDSTQANFYDLPPESFLVPSHDEQDWYHLNAIMERKTSRKLGGYNGYSGDQTGRRTKRHLTGGLPKAKISCGTFSGNIMAGKKHLVRSRSEPGGNPGFHISEPVSPRVSCTGRVGLRRDEMTGFGKLLSSLFRTRSGKYVSKKTETRLVPTSLR